MSSGKSDFKGCQSPRLTLSHTISLFCFPSLKYVQSPYCPLAPPGLYPAFKQQQLLFPNTLPKSKKSFTGPLGSQAHP